MQVNLVIAEWNANGILNHLNEIEIFLNENFIDILLISESHLTSKSHLRIKDYDIITANHPGDKVHGGAAILVKSNIKYEIAESVKEPFLQAAGVKLTCDNSTISIYSVYFPPRYTVKCDKYMNFFKGIGNKFIVGGDFNAKHTWWGSRLINPKGSELYKCVSVNRYNVTSTGKPTYWPSDPAKLPDLLDFFIHSGIHQSFLDIVASDDLSSDHTPIILNFRTTHIKKQLNAKLFNHKTNHSLFQSHIQSNLDLNIKIKDSYDLDCAVENFTKLIHDAALRATPQEGFQNFSSFRTSVEIKQLIRSKRRLRKIYQRTRRPLDKTNFNRAANHLKKIMKEYKNACTGNFLINLSPAHNNEHNLYKATKYLKRPQQRNITIRDNNGSWCRTDKSKASAFKTHLEKIFTPFSTCSNQDSNEILNFLDVPCQMCLPIKPFRTKEIENEVRKLNSKKSPGFDLIDGKVIKSLPKKGVIFLTVLFNSALRLSHFPTLWKCAKIIMVLKPNKPENSISSYRPISLLPVFSKLFERLFQKRLLPLLENLKIVPDHQFGFRNSHGTPEQCHRVVNVIRNCLERKEYCSSVFLDVKQAFDKVWHEGLLFKLKHFLPTPFYLLIKSYLRERTFYVNISDEDSEICDVKSGVPQGSVLGPILYTLFTSDMPTSNEVTIATYADDTAILATNESPIEASKLVQHQLNLTETWFKKWNTAVNTDKSIQVTYTLRKGDCPPVTFNGVTIPTSNCVKYLGLHIDRRLNWKQHVKHKKEQLNIKTRKMYWLIGPKSQLNLENKVIIYKTILKPVWTYGIQLWGTASTSNIEILQRYQSKTLRLISNAPWFVNNNNIHNDLGVPKIHSEIVRYSTNYLNRLSYHPNILAINLLNDSDEVRRLKRHHVLDLPFL